MGLELRIQDAPRQDLAHFQEYIYTVRIENRPDITLEEAFRKRSLVDPRSVPFLQFDLPAHIVCPGCEHDWQKSLYVMQLKKLPYESSVFLIREAIKFGVLDRSILSDWDIEEKPRLNLEHE
jgi:hypothetical protein